MDQTPIQNKLQNLPSAPGVYQFFDSNDKLLYIGKAKKLRNRVRSYFAQSADLTPAKRRMVNRIRNIEYIVTDTEIEALLLETTLIKAHKPPYNVILKDDKYWQYLKIDYDREWPELYSVRRPDFSKKTKSVYFGPYTSTVKDTIRLIKKIFPVCLTPPQRKLQRPKACFNYHLGKCPGPCVGKVTPTEYAVVFEDIKKFISGSQTQLIERLKEKMLRYSYSQHFEAAGRVRDQIKAIKKLNQKQKVVTNTQEHIDIVSLYQEGTKACINLFKVRNGKLLDKFNVLVNTANNTEPEVVTAFIEQYYALNHGHTDDTPHYIISEYPLSIRHIFDIPIKQTHKGNKFKLVQLGKTNAREYLLQRQTFFDQQTKKENKSLKAIQKILHLPTAPHRIETYDISNNQGTLAVGSMVVFEAGRALKKDYRQFKIKLKNTPDDPLMIYETIYRRLRRLHATEEESFSKKPDLIVIDGGVTQLNSAVRAQKELGLTIPMIGLAKKQEEIYLPSEKETLVIPKNNPGLQLLQRGRDEAHRFAITAYRKRHNKQTTQSVLDEIPGIGPKTRQILNKRYPSIAAIQLASDEELSKLIGSHKAKIIKKSL